MKFLDSRIFPTAFFVLLASTNVLALKAGDRENLNHRDEPVTVDYFRHGRKLSLALDPEGIWYTSISFPKFGKIQFFADEAKQVVKHLLIESEKPTDTGGEYYCGLRTCRGFRFENGDLVSIYSGDEETFLKVFDSTKRKHLEITEDAALHTDSGYIFSNERSPYYFKPALDQLDGGTLISVGTFRSLIDAGLGNFDRLVMLDISEKVVQFNRVHLSLLRAIGRLNIPIQFQRYQYFAFMHCSWLSDKQLRDLETYDRPEQHSVMNEAFLREFDSFLTQRSNRCDSKQLPPGFEKLMDEFKGIQISTNEYTPPGFKKISRSGQGFFGGYYLSDSSRPSYYWENNADWKKLQKLIQKDDLARAIVGDLYGANTLRTLGEALKTNKEYVTAVDVSNVIDYFKNGGIGNAETKSEKLTLQEEKNESLLKNLGALPLRSDALIMRTSTRKIEGAPRDDNKWFYFWSKKPEPKGNQQPTYEDWYTPTLPLPRT